MCVAACPPGKDAVTPQESERIHQTHQESIRQWRKRKRMVCYITFSMAFSYFFLFQAMPSLLVCFYLTFNPSFSQYRYLISTQFLNCSEQAARVPVLHQVIILFFFSQATEIVNAVLEGYPKSKKELYVCNQCVSSQYHNIQ